MPELENRGLLSRPIKYGDFVLGTVTDDSSFIKLQSDRDFTPYLPKWEAQSGKYGDTYGCVTFSALNDLEVLNIRKYGYEINISDNFTVVMSGTQPGKGNYLTTVGDSVRKNDGILIPESKLTWNPDTDTIDYYYDKSRITPELILDAKSSLDIYSIRYRWVLPNINDFWTALEYGPIQITVNTTAQEVDGIFQPVDSSAVNHAILLYMGKYGEYWGVYDHYDYKFKKYAWDFNFGPSLQYSLTKKNNMKLIKSNDPANKTVFLVDNLGNRRVFFNERHFNSVAPALGLAKTIEDNGGQTDWSQVQEISEEELNNYPLAGPIYETIG